MVIWLSILAIVAVAVCAMMLVDRRRGSTGASRGDDMPGAAKGRPGPLNLRSGEAGGWGAGGDSGPAG
ncbi:MAG TPA: hypothetical protein VE503_09440 [Ornithinibacter sp.]|nr:hypothetical protein [Ornithinibacter sp.]